VQGEDAPGARLTGALVVVVVLVTYIVFLVAGGLIGKHVNKGASGVIVGGGTGFIAASVALLLILKLLKRLHSRAS
jgi:hypothetical protein